MNKKKSSAKTPKKPRKRLSAKKSAATTTKKHPREQRKQEHPLIQNSRQFIKRASVTLWSFIRSSISHLQQARHRRKFNKDTQSKTKPDIEDPKQVTIRQKLLHFINPLTWLKFAFSLRGIIFALKTALIILILSCVTLTVLYLHYRQDVPKNIGSLQECIGGKTTEYYDRTGQILLWASKDDVDCRPVQLHEVSPHLIDALLSVEDKSFYEHGGFQPSAIARAIWNNLTNRNTAIQGGSTITQQYIKNAILEDSRKNYERKIKELLIALELERSFEKDEILVAYLNTVSFGSVYSGIEAAATGYFDKPSFELTLDEAALLVAALPAPSLYWNNAELHRQRQLWVLQEVLRDGKITQEEYDQAAVIDTLAKINTTNEQYENILAPHFVLEVEKRLTEELCAIDVEQLPTTGGNSENCPNIRLLGYKVITTLDMPTQQLIQQTVNKVIPEILERGFDNAGGVAVDITTGKVLGLVGSRDFQYPEFGQTNVVTQQRDPGSAFKIFDYGALIENSTDWGPGSVFYDYKTTFDKRGWTPQNYSGRHAGPITMRKALGHSLNIPAVKAMYIAGMETVHQFAYNAGIETPLPCRGGCGLSSAFGGGAEVRLDELTNSYATFGRSGIYLPLTYVDHIKDSEERIIRQWRSKPQRVFRQETAYALNHMLADQKARYTAAYNLNPHVQTTMAVKTGTDDAFVNNHIIGYSKSVAFGGWMGNHDEAVTFDTERHTTAPKALMIKTFMESYHRNISYDKKNHWSRPAGIQKLNINSLTGYQVIDDQEVATDEIEELSVVDENHADIFPSWYIPRVSPQTALEETVHIDTVSGRTATVCTPPRAIKAVQGVVLNSELPIDDPSYETWQEAISDGLLDSLNLTNVSSSADNVHSCQDQKPIIGLIEQPTSCSHLCRIEITLDQGDAPLIEVLIFHNNQLLPDGRITLDEGQRQLQYDYHPLNLNSPPEHRGHLRFEVVDEKLYSATLDVLLSIDGFPPAQLPPDIPTEPVINEFETDIEEPVVL